MSKFWIQARVFRYRFKWFESLVETGSGWRIFFAARCTIVMQPLIRKFTRNFHYGPGRLPFLSLMPRIRACFASFVISAPFSFFVFILRAWRPRGARKGTPSSRHYALLMNGLKGNAYKSVCRHLRGRAQCEVMMHENTACPTWMPNV